MTRDVLKMALDALEDSRDDVCECLNAIMTKAGWARYDRQIATYEDQLNRHDAAIEAATVELAKPEQDDALKDDLVLLVWRLAASLRRAKPGSQMAQDAIDFINRQGLTPSPLRGSIAKPESEPVGWGHRGPNGWSFSHIKGDMHNVPLYLKEQVK